MEDKIPPHDLDAEQSVLGSMMMSRDAVGLVVGRIRPDHFYRRAHASIFTAILTLYQKNEPIDLVTVSAELKQMNQLEDAGGRQYLAEIIHYVPTAANAETYAALVTEKAMLRRLIDAGGLIIRDAFDHSQEVAEVLESAQKQISDIANEQTQDDFVKLNEVLKNVFDDIQSVYDNEDRILGVPTGIADLDTLTSGFQKGDLIILAARPSMGKTTLALNFAAYAALEKKIPVAVFSLEMPKEQLALRMLSFEAKIDSKRLRTANLHEHEYKSLMQALGNLSEAPIFIDDKSGLSPLEIRSKLRRLQAEHDIKLVIIDYLQLMRSSKKKTENRYQEVSEIVRDVKAFAKEAGIAVIALSQLSRAVEQRSADDRMPRLSDLRESGEIEQTADLVMFIHRDDYYNQQSGPEGAHSASLTDIAIAKHRNGPTGSVKVMFRRDISRFLAIDQMPSHSQPG